LAGKREDIIRIAAALMESNGYENTKLSDILEASGTGKGQFYYYFNSKRELGLSVIDYSFSSFERNMLSGILCSVENPETKFEKMLEWIVAFHQSKQAKCGCVFGNLALEMSEHDEGFREKLNDVFKIWAKRLEPVLSELMGTSDITGSAEVEKLSRSIVAMIEGGILLMKNSQDIRILQDMTDRIRYLVGSYSASHAAS